jgi:hypothetical protein
MAERVGQAAGALGGILHIIFKAWCRVFITHISESCRLLVRMSSKGVRSPSTQPSLQRGTSSAGGAPNLEEEEDFFKFSDSDCRSVDSTNSPKK